MENDIFLLPWSLTWPCFGQSCEQRDVNHFQAETFNCAFENLLYSLRFNRDYKFLRLWVVIISLLSLTQIIHRSITFVEATVFIAEALSDTNPN
jgi:hypothetical protein